MLNHMKRENNYTTTENGAVTHKSTLKPILDVFALGGAVRNRVNDQLYHQMIVPAIESDPVLAMKTIFYLADIRGGQGERELFKLIIRKMAKDYPQLLAPVVPLIPYYTRWDYLYALDGTQLENLLYETIASEVRPLMKNKTSTSLVFKWLKSINTSSKESVRLGHKTAVRLGLKDAAYRKLLSEKRALLSDAVVERKLSARKFSSIDYSKVPSRAGLIYKNAFKVRDPHRYADFILKVSKGAVKINVSTLYPHDLIYRVRQHNDDSDTVDVMWKNLKNYVPEGVNVLPMVDVSDSMNSGISAKSQVTAMDVAIGFGIYLAEHNTGKFANHFMTFSGTPELIEVTGTTLYNKYNAMRRANWSMNTNIVAAFQLILNTAVKYNVPAEDMPDKIVIFSDMEFDRCAQHPSDTIYEGLTKKFTSHGYELPQIVFWNVCARNNTTPVTFDQRGTALVSGMSPSTLQFVLSGVMKTPEELMLEVLSSSRYNAIEAALTK